MQKSTQNRSKRLSIQPLISASMLSNRYHKKSCTNTRTISESRITESEEISSILQQNEDRTPTPNLTTQPGIALINQINDIQDLLFSLNSNKLQTKLEKQKILKKADEKVYIEPVKDEAQKPAAVKDYDQSSSLIMMFKKDKSPKRHTQFNQSSDLVNNAQTLQSRPMSTQPDLVMNVSSDSPRMAFIANISNNNDRLGDRQHACSSVLKYQVDLDVSTDKPNGLPKSYQFKALAIKERIS